MSDRRVATAPGQARPTTPPTTPPTPTRPIRPEPVPLAFHALTFQPDGDEVAVGRLETGEFVVLPADGAALLRQLVDGTPPPDAAAWYERTCGESVDVEDFVADLGELGFLRPPGEAPAPPPAPVRWQRRGRAVFSPGGAVLYGALIAAWVVTLVRSPELAPGYQHLARWCVNEPGLPHTAIPPNPSPACRPGRLGLCLARLFVRKLGMASPLPRVAPGRGRSNPGSASTNPVTEPCSS